MTPQTVNLDHVIESWSNCGFDSQYHSETAGYSIQNEIRDTDELIMLLDGAMRIELDGEIVQPKRGEVLLIPALKPHSIVSVGGAETTWLSGIEREDPCTD